MTCTKRRATRAVICRSFISFYCFGPFLAGNPFCSSARRRYSGRGRRHRLRRACAARCSGCVNWRATCEDPLSSRPYFSTKAAVTRSSKAACPSIMRVSDSPRSRLRPTSQCVGIGQLDTLAQLPRPTVPAAHIVNARSLGVAASATPEGVSAGGRCQSRTAWPRHAYGDVVAAAVAITRAPSSMSIGTDNNAARSPTAQRRRRSPQIDCYIKLCLSPLFIDLFTASGSADGLTSAPARKHSGTSNQHVFHIAAFHADKLSVRRYGGSISDRNATR